MNPASTPWIVEATDADFNTKVIHQSYDKLVVVDFWAPWCGPCRMFTPILEKVIGEYQGEMILAKVNTDENQDLAATHYIEALPTVKIFRDGQIVFQFQGMLMEAQLREVLERLRPTEEQKLSSQARALEQSDPAHAEELYRKALAQDERLEQAAIGLARLLIPQGKEDEAKELLENVAAGGELAEEMDRLQALIYLRQCAREAGDEAALRQQIEADPNKAQPRYELGCRLAVKGDYPQALEMLITAGELDYKLLTSKVREAMVQIFHLAGNQSALANDYRQRLSSLLY